MKCPHCQRKIPLSETNARILCQLTEHPLSAPDLRKALAEEGIELGAAALHNRLNTMERRGLIYRFIGEGHGSKIRWRITADDRNYAPAA